MIVTNYFKNMDNSKPTTPKRTTKGTVGYLNGRPITWAPVKSKIKKRKHRHIPTSARKTLFTNEPKFRLCLCVDDQQEIEISWTDLNGQVVTSNEQSRGPRIIAYIPIVIGTLSNEPTVEICLTGNRQD